MRKETARACIQPNPQALDERLAKTKKVTCPRQLHRLHFWRRNSLRVSKLQRRHPETLALDNSNSSLQATKPPTLVTARLLGHFLLLVPNADDRKALAKDNNDTSFHYGLIELAQFLYQHFIKTYRQVWTTVRNEFIPLIVKRSSWPTQLHQSTLATVV